MTHATPPNPNQLSNLPGLTHYLTGHDPTTGQAIIQESNPAQWKAFGGEQTCLHEIYTTSESPPNLNANIDIHQHNRVMAAGTLGLTHPGGAVCRIVDFAPWKDQGRLFMHRTQSLDYGILLEGSIELVLDSGETQTLRRGEVVIQRATMHSWRNPSTTEWARMFFVMQHCQDSVMPGISFREEWRGGCE